MATASYGSQGSSGGGGGGGSGTVTSVGSADASVTVLNPTTTPDLSVLKAPLVQASWTLGLCRVYAIDGVNGSDANKGYADPATSSAADYAVACAAAGAVALKTFAGLGAILPRDGAGRTCEIVIASATYTGNLQSFLAGVAGYIFGIPVIRGTSTSATAGCTAFDGSLADCTFMGGVTGTGMNAAGYTVTGVPTTTSIQLLKVGGGAPGFAGEPALPMGLSVRGDSSGARNANVRQFISKVSGGDTLTFGTVLPTLPVVGDIFYIEQPGVIMPASGLGENDCPPSNAAQLNGIAFSGTLTIRDGRFNVAFCTATTLNASSCRNLDIFQGYTHPVRGFIQIGGTRSSGASTITACVATLPQLSTVTSLSIKSPVSTTILTGCAYGTGITLQNGLTGFAANIGTSTPIVGVGPRIIGPGTEAGLHWNSYQGSIAQLDITGMGAKPAIWLEGTECGVELGGSNNTPAITGSTGNTDVGLDCMKASGATIRINTNVIPTVTGTAGDVRVANGTATGQIITWAQAAAGFIDSNGNRFVGQSSTGKVSGISALGIVGKFSGAIVTSAIGATTSYLADSGSALAVANLSVPQRYPTSVRLVMRLRACVVAVSGALANAATATLYKNAVATAMTVSIPAGSVAGTVFVDVAHPILFSDGDTFDVRLDDASDASAGTMSVSATLEGPV